MIPKNIALAAPAPTALLLAPPLVARTHALRAVIFGINAFANVLLRVLKVDPKGEVVSVFTDGELVRLVKDSSDAGLLDPEDGERLQDALELGTRPAGEVMVPLNRMISVSHDNTPQQLERTAAASGFSRMPVTGPDNEVLGYLHIKDALGVPERTRPFPRSSLHTVIRVEIDSVLVIFLVTALQTITVVAYTEA